ncbi:hypothetical protein [Sulfitobacter pontiacus]|uniref:hypothetical protein n=1 Tax=Sulfitobacter pontiacus TaxID=60137 RepID=UPI0030EB8F0E
MIDHPFTPPNEIRLLLQHRPKSPVRSDPANHVKGANRQRLSSNLRQACGQNVQTADFNLTNNASAAVTSPTDSALSP